MNNRPGKKDKNRVPKAVALRHDQETEAAPRVTAKGQGQIARKILELAKQNNIPVREDEDLVEMLSALEIDQEIPPELYAVVAEILAMIYRVNQKA